jgi:D-amino-acid dehydrogenase
MKSDYVIIGGGLAGVSTLYELTKRGQDVILLEEKNDIALETSFANGGMLTPSMADPWNSPGIAKHLINSLNDPYSAMKLRLKAIPGMAQWGLKFLYNSTPRKYYAATKASFELSKFSLNKINNLIDELNIQNDYLTNGTIKVFKNEKPLLQQIKIANMLSKLGMKFKVLNSNETIKIEPLLIDSADEIIGSIYYKDDASGDARLFTKALEVQVKKLGAKIITNSKVKKIIKDKNIIAGVETENNFIRTSNVIISAGNNSPSLVSQFGIKLSIKPVKGYSLTFELEGTNQLPRLPVIDDSMHAAIVPLGKRLRAVGTAELAGFDKTIPRERIENLKFLFKRLYPNLFTKIDWGKAKPWAGLRPMSADSLPFIGKFKNIEGLWINSGHGHLGWTMSLGSASLLADLILNTQTSINPFPYRADR